MYDVLIVLLSQPVSPHNSLQCLRAWICLASSKEIDLRALYLVGAQILERSTRARNMSDDDGLDAVVTSGKLTKNDSEDELRQQSLQARAHWLRFTNEGKWNKVDKLLEYVLTLASAGKLVVAFDELETFLPAHPYHDSIKLNVLAGHLALLLAQPRQDDVAALASTEEDDDDDDEDESEDGATEDDEDETGADGSSSPRKHGNKRAAPSVDDQQAMIDFLMRLSRFQPAFVDKATEYFRQAARLEKQSPDLATGEGARWLALLDKASSTLSKRKRSESPD
ncbi:hypothetical protein OIO90_006045 [Microbotryomycetes sp. JL221]|nr:hypothetical protein OIO90_006045 [Microbotryomycetes sp. JL221]